jgi:predicted MFS family arabinose efflux permease
MPLFNKKNRPIRDINSKTFVFAALLLAIFAPNGFNFLPLMLGGAGEELHLVPSQIEALTTWELIATSSSSVIFSLFLIRRVNWRKIGMLAALLMVIMNFVCLTAEDFQSLLTYRIINGFGQGIGYSLAIVGLSVSAKPGKYFGWWVAAVNLWLSIWFFILPRWMEHSGLDVLFVFYAITACLAVVVFWWYPDNGRLERDAVLQNQNSGNKYHFKQFLIPSLIVASVILIYHFSVGIVYPYLEIIGTNAAISGNEIGLVISIGSIAAIGSGFVAAWLDGRSNDRLVLLFVGIIQAVSIYILANATNLNSYIIGTILYLLGFNLFTAKLFTVMATTDRSGYLASFGPELQAVGIALGPVLAQALTESGNYSGQIIIGMWAVIIATALISIKFKKPLKDAA